MAVDIEHFKLFNEWYGEEAGDLFLEEVGSCSARPQPRAAAFQAI